MCDVFFRPEYGKLYEKIEGGVCEFFEYKGADGTVRNMYIKRPVPWLVDGKQYYDVSTPYGYGGPFLADGISSPELIASYYQKWTEHCKANQIVAEFIRFHLFDNAAFRTAYPGEVVQVSNNVVRDLNPSQDEMWMQFEQKVRKNVKRAMSNGLRISIETDGSQLDEFLHIYYATMERNNAKDYYYFERSYFEDIIKTLPDSFAFFNVWHDDVMISTELVLCSDKYVYSFLGGTLDEYYPLRPNDFLKWEIIKWSKETGHTAFILGGGYGADDGIYRYKKAFAPGDDVPFYVGRSVFNEAVYKQLVAEREKAGRFNTNYFPLYRG